MRHQYIERVVNLTDQSKNVIYNMSIDKACKLIKSGDPEAIRSIDGHFALISVEGKSIHLARSISRPLRYFIAKLVDGPCLVIAERIDTIYDYLKEEGLDHQFRPSYTRMIPAHYITHIELLGCPDPDPVYKRFFTPKRNTVSLTDVNEFGAVYINSVYQEIKKWLIHRATSGPIGVSFSGGIDSGSVFLLAYHALLELGESPSRLKAFTLSVDGHGKDIEQAYEFMKRLRLDMFLEPIEVDLSDLDWCETIHVMEDYKPLDVQSATMNYALHKGIRKRYPDWKYVLDGDGGDENMKDYPIEENPELTIRSVLNNMMLYQEGWGVGSMKHSLTYSGGLSRGYMRTFTPVDSLKFEGCSPYTSLNVIEIAESYPFIEITNWDHEKLYSLKGKIVADGIKAVTGIDMPVFPKRRFQHGVATSEAFETIFPKNEKDYLKHFQRLYE